MVVLSITSAFFAYRFCEFQHALPYRLWSWEAHLRIQRFWDICKVRYVSLRIPGFPFSARRFFSYPLQAPQSPLLSDRGPRRERELLRTRERKEAP